MTRGRTLARSSDTTGAERQALAATVRAGLTARPKRLPPKLFYDERGAALFELICRQPEYYLWRSELEILVRQGRAIADLIGPGVALIDLGSGAGDKAWILLSALREPAAYVPVDIAGDQLIRLARKVAGAYPSIAVRPVLDDYSRLQTLPSLPRDSRRVAYFAGSTIGNLNEIEAVAFLGRLRRLVGPSGGILLGADRVKDRDTLEAAYNDAIGATAAFNLNVLGRLNRELGADFDLSRFRHVAFFDEETHRIEMHLESLGEQAVTVDGVKIRFDAGERIWTESSYKYDLATLERMASGAGLDVAHLFTDRAERFWVCWLVPRS